MWRRMRLKPDFSAQIERLPAAWKMFPPSLLFFCLGMSEFASEGWVQWWAKIYASTPCLHQQPRDKMMAFSFTCLCSQQRHMDRSEKGSTLKSVLPPSAFQMILSWKVSTVKQGHNFSVFQSNSQSTFVVTDNSGNIWIIGRWYKGFFLQDLFNQH